MKTTTERKFDPTQLWRKISQNAKNAGIRTIYVALLLYYSFRRKETPRWAKGIVLGALGYFLSPIDNIPDLTPFLGYTDDLGVMMFALITISAFINDSVKQKAQTQLKKWFPTPDEEVIADVNSKL